ncbi:fluoride efflux transporter FluC [Sanguibacter inulinus]|uniref:Fluoride-specific ion channel FluC n=1 Tax=Sanguibacter inulinus TaxID=60922 RepID=A0A853EU91_9MICO|nr:CrcB family protein [Sanguibacter inulinus]MBF0723030.1 CrcB family protein [Sanguibacter inulinus]NYS94175.1 CrcB family protein [Sanguibacter inulinus]
MTHDRPVDPDLDTDATDAAARAVPQHLRWSSVALVAVGGTLGAALRELLVLAFPVTGSLDVVIFCINFSGALALGVLLESLVRSGPEDDRRRHLRLLLGTGVLGGYTTYSTLATQTARLVGDGQAGLAVLYSLGTLLLGALATWTGIALASWLRRPRRSRRSA